VTIRHPHCRSDKALTKCLFEVKSDGDDFTETAAHAEHLRKRGTIYAVAIDPDTREVLALGAAPDGLTLDFDAIIDA
jgi:hypothetical protein